PPPRAREGRPPDAAARRPLLGLPVECLGRLSLPASQPRADNAFDGTTRRSAGAATCRESEKARRVGLRFTDLDLFTHGIARRKANQGKIQRALPAPAD